MRGFDAWLTHDPKMDEPDVIPQPKCDKCGRFVKSQPCYVVSVEEVATCSGRLVDEYGEDWGPECEAIVMQRCPLVEHFYPVAGYGVLYRECSNGHLAKEFVV